jgi:hypothetical protein
MQRPPLSLHIALFLLVSVMTGLVYAAVQQSYRSTANDPQVQIALDLKQAIERKQSSAPLLRDSIDIANSLSPFETLYDSHGNAIQSTGFIDGHAPALPGGVLDAAATHGENVITWQPRSGVRMALVIEAVRAEPVVFVAVGRSLRLVEKREAALVTLVVIAWVVCAGIIALHFLYTAFLHPASRESIR